MPKQVKARAAQDEQEERTVRKLAKSHHAPADWKFHAQMVLNASREELRKRHDPLPSGIGTALFLARYEIGTCKKSNRWTVRVGALILNVRYTHYG